MARTDTKRISKRCGLTTNQSKSIVQDEVSRFRCGDRASYLHPRYLHECHIDLTQCFVSTPSDLRFGERFLLKLSPALSLPMPDPTVLHVALQSLVTVVERTTALGNVRLH